jgi:hypothetical protein
MKVHARQQSMLSTETSCCMLLYFCPVATALSSRIDQRTMCPFLQFFDFLKLKLHRTSCFYRLCQHQNASATGARRRIPYKAPTPLEAQYLFCGTFESQ